MVANLFNLVGVAPFDRSKMKRDAWCASRGSRACRRQRAAWREEKGVEKALGALHAPTRALSASGARSAPRRSASPPTRRASAPRLNTLGRPPKSARVAGADSRVRDAPFLETAFPTKSQLLRGGPRSLRDLDFSLYAFEALPRTIRDAEGELSRAGEFERCFPTSDPVMNARYLELFETRRHENELLCAWERHKKALRGRKPANGTPREASSSARKRDAPTRSASIIKGVARLASRGDERVPLGSARPERVVAFVTAFVSIKHVRQRRA